MHEPGKNSTQQQPSKSSANNLPPGGVSMAAVPPFLQGQKVQLKVSTGNRQEVVQRMTFEEGETKIGDLTGENFEKKPSLDFFKDSSDEEESEALTDLPASAVQTFKDIQTKLSGIGWDLKKSAGPEHCYTEVIRHYWTNEKEAETEPHHIPEWAMNVETGENKEQIIPDAQFEKIVYYHPACPLIDLIHEMDHVQQQEEVHKSTGDYLYTTWDAWDWDGKKFEPRSEGANSAFSSDEENAFRKLVTEKLRFGDQELSKGQNEYAEYHNYLREYLRYCEWGAPDSKKEEIVSKINQHKDSASTYALENEEDTFIKACESIKPIKELENEYEIARSKKGSITTVPAAAEKQ